MNKQTDKSIRNYTIEDLEAVLDKLPYEVWLKNKDGKYIYVNKLGAEKVGLSKDQILDKSDYEIRDYHIAEKCDKTDKAVIDSKHDIYTEEYNKIDSGEIRYKVHKFLLNEDKSPEMIIGGIATETTLDKNIQLYLEKNLLNYFNTSKVENDSIDILSAILSDLKEALNCKNIEILLYDEDKKSFNLYLSENKESSKFKNNFQICINKYIEDKLCCTDIYENRYSEIYDKIIKSQNNMEDNLKIKHIELANKLYGLICISYDKDTIYKDESYLDELLNKVGFIIKQIENKNAISFINEKKHQLEAIIGLEAIKTEFFANISHEFRTPLTVILSIVQLLNSYTRDVNVNLNDEKFKEYLNILKQNSYRLLRLINNVMDASKINSNFYDIKLRNCNIVSLVENITMATVKHVNELQRNIIFDTDEEEVILACDPEKIEKAILNLISNAVKFSYCNTDIEVIINTDLDENKVFISIKNYGENIKDEYREKIFGKFTQLDDLLNRRAEGSGIGLYLSRKFVEMHNGKIYVDNIEDATQLTFYLPINPIEDEYMVDEIINAHDLEERCNIEFSDIYK